MGTIHCWSLPTTRENPCILCADGATAGNDFAPYAEIGYLKPCEVFIEYYRFLDAENSICSWKRWEEALCCPTEHTNPCNICPDGATAADDYIPFAEAGEPFSCKKNIDTFKLIEAESEYCSEFGPIYNVGCCPNVMVAASTTVEEISTAATPTASTAATTIFTTGATTTSAAFTSPDAATTSVTGNVELITSGGVIVSHSWSFRSILFGVV
jgi:hypothetical protein